MVARHERDRLDFVRLESAQIAVLDEVVGVFVVALVTDVDADVVENRGVLQPVALAIGQAVNGARLIEQADAESRDLLCMVRPVVAPFCKLEHAAAADVGVAIRLRDLLPVPGDVVEDKPFPQREIAERNLVGAEPSQELVQQNRAGHRQVRAPRLEAGHAQPLLEVERHHLFAHAANQLR
jgi:hypothetical protein